MKNFISKLLISIYMLFAFCGFSFAKEKVFVSTSPSMTEIMYALGAQDMLKAVSTTCSYPEEAKEKPVIGDAYYINGEMLMKIKPDYFLAPDLSEFMLSRFKAFGITLLCYKYANIEEIYKNILTLGKLTGKEKKAIEINQNIQKKIETAQKNNKNSGKKILYLIQTAPLMTIGNKSFITDVIEKSGNISITSNLNSYYPVILEEYAIKQKPDIIILDFHCGKSDRIKKLFPDTKIIKMTKEQTDIIDRPGPRIYQSVEFFAKLK